MFPGNPVIRANNPLGSNPSETDDDLWVDQQTEEPVKGIPSWSSLFHGASAINIMGDFRFPFFILLHAICVYKGLRQFINKLKRV